MLQPWNEKQANLPQSSQSEILVQYNYQKCAQTAINGFKQLHINVLVKSSMQTSVGK